MVSDIANKRTKKRRSVLLETGHFLPIFFYSIGFYFVPKLMDENGEGEQNLLKNTYRN